MDFYPASIVQNLRPKQIKDLKRLEQTFHKREHPIANKHIKRCSTPLVIRKKKKLIKTIMRYDNTFPRMAIPRVGKNVEKLEPPYTVDGNEN